MVKVADLNHEKTVRSFKEPESFFDLEDKKKPSGFFVVSSRVLPTKPSGFFDVHIAKQEPGVHFI